jgi:hypothetical protein
MVSAELRTGISVEVVGEDDVLGEEVYTDEEESLDDGSGMEKVLLTELDTALVVLVDGGSGRDQVVVDGGSGTDHVTLEAEE